MIAKRSYGLVLSAFLLAAPAGAVDFVINNVDQAGIGFNDPTPASPVGGNDGSTLGEQRLKTLERAVEIWGATLQSDVPVVVQASFQPLTCTPTAAILAAAGTIQIFRDFSGGLPLTWYHSALANKRAGQDFTPGPPDPGRLSPPFNDDINVDININVDSDPACLGGGGWYYGFDHNEGAGADLLAVLLHELSHGLGFSNFVTEENGQFFGDGQVGSPCRFGCRDIYSLYTFDFLQGKSWPQMNNAQRAVSAVSDPFVVWSGPITRAFASVLLDPQPEMIINAPASIAGRKRFQPAEFGPSPEGLNCNVVLANDGVGELADACEGQFTGEGPWPGGLPPGSLVLVDRGTCSFVQKTLNAQAEGAAGVLIANNTPGLSLPPMGDDGNGGLVTIPSVGISNPAGETLKAALLTDVVNVTLTLEGEGLAGTLFGFPRLHAPNPVAPGSSISHWTGDASPNLLMEPAISFDLTDFLDLTVSAFLEEGWSLTPPAAARLQNLEGGGN